MSSHRNCIVGFLWSEFLETFDFGKKHPIKIGRFRMLRDFVDENGLLKQSNVRMITPELLSEELLHKIHAEDYLTKLKKISETGVGDIDIDTPGFKNIYFNTRITAGASVTGVRSVMSGDVDHFISPTGGFHHARYEDGGGFSIVNDVAACVYTLKEQGFKRILITDFDVHHANGTQTYFYEDPEVMHISFHEDPEWLYPHDGWIPDIGNGPGIGYNINMHFPMDSCDSVYRFAFDELVPPLIDFYKPEFIIFIPGFDTLYTDRLAHLNLTTDMIRYISEYIHYASHTYCDGKMGVLTGGGYTRKSLTWGFATVMSVLTGHHYEAPPQTPPYDDDEETWEIVRSNVQQVKDLVFSELGI
jgi:acetoin utilization protein AcuC